MNQKKSQIVVGNWKMNGLIEHARKLASSVVEEAKGVSATVVICPPFTLLRDLADITRHSAVLIGGQDCHYEKKGAFTGNISPEMLRDLTCEYVILGHSERRSNHYEDNALVKMKASAAHEVGLTTIICVGETEGERESSKTLTVIEQQVLESLPESANNDNTVIAYEPIWAIGSGKTAHEDDIIQAHEHIINVASGPEYTPQVLYGGSVSAKNAQEILSSQGVGGVLVGGSSLKIEDFGAIVKAAK